MKKCCLLLAICSLIIIGSLASQLQAQGNQSETGPENAPDNAPENAPENARVNHLASESSDKSAIAGSVVGKSLRFDQATQLYLPIPNSEMHEKDITGRDVLYKFNGLGLRGPDFQESALKRSVDVRTNTLGKVDTLRIAVLGAGIFGRYLGEDETPTALLQKYLDNLANDARIKVQVLNAQMPGFFSTRSAIHTAQIIYDFKPQLILYFISSSDVPFEVFETRSTKYDELGRPQKISGLFANVNGGEAFTQITSATSERSDATRQAVEVSKLMWSGTTDKEQLLNDLMSASQSNFGLLGAPTAVQGRFYLLTAPRPFDSDLFFSPLRSAMATILKFLTPTLPYTGKQFALSVGGYQQIRLQQEFSSGVRNGLILNRAPGLLTLNGAREWARWVGRTLSADPIVAEFISAKRFYYRSLISAPGKSKAK